MTIISVSLEGPVGQNTNKSLARFQEDNFWEHDYFAYNNVLHGMLVKHQNFQIDSTEYLEIDLELQENASKHSAEYLALFINQAKEKIEADYKLSANIARSVKTPVQDYNFCV